MKIVLVSTYPKDVFFPIALLALRSYLLAKLEDIEIILIPGIDDSTVETIVANDPDLIGLSAMTPSYEVATTMAWELKSRLLNVPIVIGGVHLTLLPESFRRCFDVAAIGEGENTLCDLTRLLRRDGKFESESLASIPGLLFWKEGRIESTGRPKPVDLSAYPDIDYSILDDAIFTKRPIGAWGRFGVEGLIETSRGCPFRCLFCATTRVWNGIRYFPPEWVARNLLALVNRGCTMVQMTDDLFACNKKRLRLMKQVFDGYELQKQVQLAVSGRTSLFDDELCELIKGVGGTTVFFGFESGNERILRMLKGNSCHVSDNINAIQICQKHRLECWGAVMLGSPTETREEILDTINFIKLSKKYGVRRVCVGVTTPYPGTPLWDMMVAEGKAGPEMDFKIFETIINAFTEPYFASDELKPIFHKLHNQAKRAAHSFKWNKALSLFKSDPLATIQFAFKAPWPIIRRMFDPRLA